MSRPTAPALERGLALLETVAAASAPPTFNDLLRRSAWPKASVARLLGVLREAGYMEKDPRSGGYRVGPRAALLTGRLPVAERLRLLAEPVLEQLAGETGHTWLLLQFADLRAVCLAKATAESSIAMQPVGYVQPDLSRSPWGVLYFDAMDEAQQTTALSRMKDAAGFAQRQPQAVAYLRQHGFTYDDQTHLKHVRRLAAPIRSDGRLVAAVGVGANPLALPDDAAPALGRKLCAVADQLEHALTGVVAHDHDPAESA